MTSDKKNVSETFNSVEAITMCNRFQAHAYKAWIFFRHSCGALLWLSSLSRPQWDHRGFSPKNSVDKAL